MMTLRRLDRFLANEFDPQNDRAIRDRLRTVVTYGLIKRMFEAFFDNDRTIFAADDSTQRVEIHELGWVIAFDDEAFQIKIPHEPQRPIDSPSQLEEYLWNIQNAIVHKYPPGSPGESPRGGLDPTYPGRYYDSD